MTKKNRDKDVTVKVTTVQPKYTFRVSKSFMGPYEEEIQAFYVKPGVTYEKLMAEGISQYCQDTENLRLPWWETWELLENDKVVLSFGKAEMEDKDKFWQFVQVIRSHGCMIFEIRNDH